MASRAEQKQEARAARLAAEEADRRSARRRASIMRLGLVLGLAVVAVVVAIVLSSSGNGGSGGNGGGGATPGDAAAANALFRGIPQKGIDLGGGSKAPTLIEFADLQCPYCAEYNNQALPTVVNNFVKTGRIRYELRLRHFLGADSETAAGAAAEATRENKLYQFADLFYHRQGEENTGYVTDGFLRGIAQGVGVDPGKALASAHSASSQALVKAAETKATSLGSNSTPDFFLRLKSGRLVKVAPQDLTGSAMSQALDQALAQT
jgi:protein-disulfide isomerase